MHVDRDLYLFTNVCLGDQESSSPCYRQHTNDEFLFLVV